jgi:hypothetical protein
MKTLSMRKDAGMSIHWTAIAIAMALLAFGIPQAKAQEKQAAATSAAPKAPAAAPHAVQQRTFDRPEAAASALVDAVRAGDRATALQVVGPVSRAWLLTTDQAADRAEWTIFLAAYDRKNAIVKKADDKAVLTVGDDDWEFPAPIVQKDGKWAFDANAGREEILNRRVGRNELDTIQTLLAIVDAQREYAATDPKGAGLRDYAMRFASSPGKKDGLYWETRGGEAPSPMGPMVAEAVRGGYGVKGGKLSPYHGYLFHMLTAQGKDAPGGAYDYMVDGHLFGGFAVVAYPDLYGITGVKTFLVSHDGVVYEKDLGPGTAAQAEAMKTFDPDPTWSKTQ